MNITAQEAYPGRTYEQRALATFQVGQRVTVGPHYENMNRYYLDGAEGEYTITRILPLFTNELTRMGWENRREYELTSDSGTVIHLGPTRLTPA